MYYFIVSPFKSRDMENLKSLFVEFNCTTIESLLASINNQIDWYTEMLYDDPWNTWAQTQITNLENLSTKVYKLFVQDGADNDIDIIRQNLVDR